MKGREIVKILKAEGWVIKATKGSHCQMQKGSRKVPVPLHGSRDLGLGLVKKIEKQTGIKLLKR